MIADALRYPAAGGRTALLATVGSVLAVAVGLRYAAAFLPSALALVPAAAVGLGLVVGLGALSRVLAGDGTPAPRSSVRAGVAALALSVVLLAPPTALLAATVAGGGAGAGVGVGAGAGIPFLVGSTATTALFLACAYALPAALAAAVRARRLRAAFDGGVVRVLTGADYFLRWTVGFALAVVATSFAGTTLRTGGGLGLVAAFAAAYLLVAGARVVAEGVAS